jgi:CRP/FNR family transcriptional regulator, cyclic AMP receptor protein
MTTRQSDVPIESRTLFQSPGDRSPAEGWTPAALKQAADTLLRIPFFAALSAEQLNQLAPAITTRHFGRGDVVIEQDGHDSALYVLARGRAHVLRTSPEGREVILDILVPGAHAGEMCLIDNQPHSATVRCLEACAWLRVEGAPLARCLAADPRLSYTLMHALVQRLRRAHRQITSLALLDVPERVMHCLREYADLGPDGVPVVRERLRRQDLARLTGASREMVSRVLLKLEAEGQVLTLPNGSMQLRPHRPQPD